MYLGHKRIQESLGKTKSRKSEKAGKEACLYKQPQNLVRKIWAGTLAIGPLRWKPMTSRCTSALLWTENGICIQKCSYSKLGSNFVSSQKMQATWGGSERLFQVPQHLETRLCLHWYKHSSNILKNVLGSQYVGWSLTHKMQSNIPRLIFGPRKHFNWITDEGSQIIFMESRGLLAKSDFGKRLKETGLLVYHWWLLYALLPGSRGLKYQKNLEKTHLIALNTLPMRCTFRFKVLVNVHHFRWNIVQYIQWE